MSNFDINQYHRRELLAKLHRDTPHRTFVHQVPPVTCADGFTMSVQASEHHYCTPRINGALKYTSFEVGYPEPHEPLLTPYAEDPGAQIAGVIYGWVPAEVINRIVANHGGIRRHGESSSLGGLK